MTTMRDVAERAAVSTATVSRVLTKHPSVRPDTAAKVFKAAEELGYVPNSLARGLRTQRTAAWALIIADISNPFLTQVARGVEDFAQAEGYSVLLCNTDEDPDKEDGYLAIAEQYRVTGVLITPTAKRSRVDGLIARGVPVVAMDRPLHGPSEVDSVLIDSRRAARAAVERMIAEGRRTIGCITGPRRVFTAEERVLGYREAMAANGIEIREDWIRYADFNEAGGREAATALFDETAVDGLLVANSLMAVGVLSLLSERGLTPREDVTIIAFDDAPWTTLLRSSIDVIHQPAYELGRTAGALLVNRLTEPQREVRTVLLNAVLDPGPRG